MDTYKYAYDIHVSMHKKVYKTHRNEKLGNRITIPHYIDAAEGYTIEAKDDGTLIYRPVHT
jgi:hypothetical protein